MSIDIFISYAHKDRGLRDELAKHLSALRNQGVINDWYDGDIIAGTEWKVQVANHLEKDQIILLLVSADFLASDFCYNIELARAIARHDSGEARVIPILLRPSDWKETSFGKLKALPGDEKAVVSWPTTDEAFLDIVKGIKRAIFDLQKSTPHAHDRDSSLLQQPDEEYASSVHQTSPSSNQTNNHIGSISGNNHSIMQTGTYSASTNNYYELPAKSKRRQALRASKKRVSDKRES